MSVLSVVVVVLRFDPAVRCSLERAGLCEWCWVWKG